MDFHHNCGRICAFTVCISNSVMASGDDHSDQAAGGLSGVTFQCELRTSWKPPKTYANLTSPGVVVLDTNVVPNVLGLSVFRADAALVRVLPGVSSNIVRVLVPDERAEPHFMTSSLKMCRPRKSNRQLGPDRTVAVLATIPAIWNDKVSGRHGVPMSGV